MTGLALQIDGKWAVLSEGDSVNIENNSPVWGEGNSFSLPFELDIEANRHILGNADQITGQSVYEVLDGKRAVLYTLGIPVYYGKIKMEDEVELSEGKVDVTLVSGNLTFDEMIDGMNCQDVELLDEIVIGTELEKVLIAFNKHANSDFSDPFLPTPLGNTVHYQVTIGSKKFITNKDDKWQSTINVAEAYPQMMYCNVPVATQNKESDKREYYQFDADRPGTGICFYVLYFLDCLFSKLKVPVVESSLPNMDDMKRLAFFSTLCDFERYPIIINTPGTNISANLSDFGIQEVKGERRGQAENFEVGGVQYTGGGASQSSTGAFIYQLNRMVATSKNFPDIEVSELMEAIKNAFGVVLLYDEKFSTVRLLFVKDILRDSSIIKAFAEIHECTKMENRLNGFELGYSSGSDDNTSFNYNDYSKVISDKVYAQMRKNVSPYDENLYIDQRTGDSFRVKIDEEALSDNTKDLNPSLVEVAEFVSAKYGDCKEENYIEKKEIGFTPIISNDVSEIEGQSKYMVYLDVDMGKPGLHEYSITNYGEYGVGEGSAYPDVGEDEAGPMPIPVPFGSLKTTVKYDGYDYSEQTDGYGSPINQYDAGFTLGIMRPGAGTKVEDVEGNYDGEGNYKYFVIADNPAFISDTIDHYGYNYDYNGDLEGGVDLSGRFSLKPRAEKPNPNAKEGESPFYPITETYAQRRGLFDKFYSEYAYFVVNRKIVRMKCRMEMADLLNIDWTKRYKIGEYVGFINKYSYSVSSTGISDVELEMYYI